MKIALWKWYFDAGISQSDIHRDQKIARYLNEVATGPGPELEIERAFAEAAEESRRLRIAQNL